MQDPMNKSPEIYWKDKSGVIHRFWIYRRGTKFNDPCPGVYIYARETSPHKWTPIYIGQAENVNIGLTDHEQQRCIDQNGATHIHISIIAKEKSRLAIEKSLIEQWKPACNAQDTITPEYDLIGEEAADVNRDFVMRDKNGEIYTVPYNAANAMLLNELLKEHRRVEKLEATVVQQRKDFQAAIAHEHEETRVAVDQLKQRVQKVSARLAEQVCPVSDLD
jgi:excinuclease UvrABC nuclease subunit